MLGSFGSAAADIVVRIKGDAKGLEDSLRTADTKLGTFGAKAAQFGPAIAGGAAIAGAAVVAFGVSALGEAERVDDALGNLTATLGEDLAAQLDETADDFSRFGQSRQDILELESLFADIATSLGVTGQPLAEYAEKSAEIAAALSTLNGGDPADWIDKIAKAAQLGEDDLAVLGIHLTEADVQSRALRDSGKDSADSLTDAETAAAAYDLILEKLNPKLEEATARSGDLSDRTDDVAAKFETLTGKVGEFLEEPAIGLLDWINHGIEGWELFGEALKTPADGLKAIAGLMLTLASLPITGGLTLLGEAGKALNGGGGSGTFSGQLSGAPGGGGGRVTVQVQDGAPDNVERATVDALRTYQRQNGRIAF